jgi:hypothetical protein
METDRAYYARRAADERRAAERAADADIRRRHLELATLLSAREGNEQDRLSRP